jgi:hypothetical protein
MPAFMKLSKISKYLLYNTYDCGMDEALREAYGKEPLSFEK